MSADKDPIQDYRSIANAFISVNSLQLAKDLLSWQRNGKLVEGALYHQLAKICEPATTIDDHYQIAERLLVTFITRQAAGEIDAQGKVL
ncbi:MULTISPECIES: hypothetical protein [Pseudomonas]|uniref:hypothetical protein n=1 Tax=Pseudomonas TaxID=286 RepID=UPI000F03EF3D|nr:MULTISPECIES: hypothetical protein [Pseudomonas]MBD8614722.1 hypothetical protein [Pseudomonas putida]MBD8681594.1 hypothetical protein [Pseudomonas sp. CFBP 13719]